MLNNLKLAGTSADKVADIILTHAHPIHIGGIVDANGDKVFTKDELYISKIERGYWMAEGPDFSKGTKNAVADFEIGFAKNILGKVDQEHKFYGDGEDLFGFLKAELSPGHTPGHMIITVFSGEESLVHNQEPNFRYSPFMNYWVLPDYSRKNLNPCKPLT